MTLTVTVDPTTISVEPGILAGCTVVVSNNGTLAQDVSLRIEGEAAEWAWMVPDRITIGSGQQASARLAMRPPRAGAPTAGAMTLTIRADTARRPSTDSVLTELTLDIAPVRDLFVTIFPVRSSGRRSALHVVTVANRGNVPVACSIAADDNQQALRFSVEPSEIAIDADSQATAELGVRPHRTIRLGSGREYPFDVTATADGELPTTASATIRQEALLGSRKSKAAAAVVMLVLCLLGIRAVSSSSSSDAHPAAGSAVTTAALDPLCPVVGHFDPSLRVQPSLESLPKDYSFIVIGDGCRPGRINPCEPVHYVTRALEARPGSEENLRVAIERVSEATGIDFVDDGPTSEEYPVGRSSFRPAFQPDRYGHRWAPILFQWAFFPQGDGNRVAGGASSPIEVNGAIVSGFVGLNAEINDDPVNKRKVIMHELAHVLGLGHTSSPSSMMFPTVRADDVRPAKFAIGDRAGLRILGRQSGCLDVPALPT